jgi:DNA-binding response OmpR family regulator
LLADDDQAIRAVYGPCLRAAGYDVREAADGREAVEAVRDQAPDLLLLDLWMPRMSGFEVLDALRHDPAATRLKVVVLSCLSDADNRFEAFSGGAVDYLVKGLALSEFLSRIAATLAGNAPAAASA